MSLKEKPKGGQTINLGGTRKEKTESFEVGPGAQEAGEEKGASSEKQ